MGSDNYVITHYTMLAPALIAAELSNKKGNDSLRPN